MPGIDGPSLLRELRRRRPELKIIFISGYAEDAFKKNLPDGEDFQFLPKPFSLKQLATTVKANARGAVSRVLLGLSRMLTRALPGPLSRGRSRSLI